MSSAMWNAVSVVCRKSVNYKKNTLLKPALHDALNVESNIGPNLKPNIGKKFDMQHLA